MSESSENKALEAKLQAGVAQIVLFYPFFAAILLRHVIAIAAEIPTACINRSGFIRFGAEFLAKLTIPEVVFVLAHEVLHRAAFDHQRRGNRNPLIWNLAADAIINQVLIDEKIGKMPEGGFTYPNALKYSREELYEKLMEEMPGRGGSAPSPDPGGAGSGSDSNDGSPTSGGQPQPGRVGAQGQVLVDCLDPSADGDAPLTDAQAKLEEAQIKQELVSAKQLAEQRGQWGTGNGPLARLIESILRPKVDWKEYLSGFLGRMRKDDWSWSRPNRRYQDFYAPSLRNPGMGPMAVIIDTSASCMGDEIVQFAAELNSLMSDLRPEVVHIIYCDTSVSHTSTHDPQEGEIPLDVRSTGGTDMRVAVEHAATLEVECAVLLTDGETPWPKSPPNYPLLVAYTSASWGKPPEYLDSVFIDLTN